MTPAGRAAAAEDPALAQEAVYQRRILRSMVLVAGPFILFYGVLALLLGAAWYLMGIYTASVVILGGGFAVLMRPQPAVRFLQVHRVVAFGYIGTLMVVQVLSIAVFGRIEFSAWILFYPSLVFLFAGRRDGVPIVAACGVAFFVPLFLVTPAAITPPGILAMKINLLLIFLIVAACTFFIDRTRRQVQADLVREKETAERASRAKSEFVGNMSHELRTPLNHVIGFSELLLGMARERGDETSAEYLSDILASGRHLLALVNDTLDLARVEEGRLALQLRPCLPRELLERSARLVADRAREKGVRLELADDIPGCAFPADMVRITQVLVNLLVNAVKFTPAGGRVTASCRVVDPNGPAPAVEFAVTDTGRGIPESQLPLLFERFSRLELPVGVVADQGAGLGLALSRGLVERHRGRIWAESDGVGHGSTFRFRVPILDPGSTGR